MRYRWYAYLLALVFGISGTSRFASTENKEENPGHEKLVRLFKEFREFVEPTVNDGIPDYTQAVMKRQSASLKEFQNRLAGIDTSTWPVSQQVDHHIVRAEMNGLDSYHRVLQPWLHNPGFYGTKLIPGFPSRGDGINVFMIELPLPENELADLKVQLQAVPKLFEQAKKNLTEPALELAIIAIRTKEKKILMFQDLVDRLQTHHPDLVPQADQALAAVIDYRNWLVRTKDDMTYPAGVGKENFNWWMKNVWLYPHTWEESMNTALREYRRAVAFLKLEENRNRNHPRLPYVSTEEGHARLWNKAENYLTQFVRNNEIFSVPDYLTPSGPHRPWVPASERDGECPEFFEQAERHDPMAQVGHNHTGHHLDHLRHQRDPRPIRNSYPLYGGLRPEALSTFMEEGMMIAGLHDEWDLNPRSREVIYISLAWRAVRAIADLKLHSNEFTLEEALQHCAEWCPRGWECKTDMDTWYDLEISMLQPGHATIYINGKNELERLIADRALQLGEAFNLRQVMDHLFSSGIIPISLARWEITGLDDEIKKLN
jgi:hypothetical protein